MHKRDRVRLAALKALVSWHTSARPMEIFFQRSCAHLAGRDLHLAKNLVYGVLRQLQYLDFIIATFSSQPLKKLRPPVHMALRLGIYQLLFLERIPDAAAVNETVDACHALHQPHWLVNFVNGVLRTVSREKASLPSPAQAGPGSDPLLNHPAWLVRRWQQRWGPTITRKICIVNNEPPQLTIRVNTHQVHPETLEKLFEEIGCTVHHGLFVDTALRLTSPRPPASLPGFREGYFHVQDEAAQLATLLLGPFEPGKRYLDACAGVGGKSCTLADMIPHPSRIIALEPDYRRFKLLLENIHRLGQENTTQCRRQTLETFAAATAQQFDAVLVDAPCSGTGVIRRHPDIRWNRRIQDLRDNQQRQLHLLDRASALLRPDGLLVYTTCSLEPEENQQVVSKFLRHHPEFRIDSCRHALPPAAACLVDDQGFFVPLPCQGLDGFFGCRLVRACGSGAVCL